MQFFGLWGASCIFPRTQALQTQSLAKETFSFSPTIWPSLWRLCKVLILTWASRRCHSQPTSAFPNKHIGPVVACSEKSTTYKSCSTYPKKATLRDLLHKRTTISTSTKTAKPIFPRARTESKLYPRVSTSMTFMSDVVSNHYLAETHYLRL